MNLAFDDFMYGVAAVGNLFLFLQAWSLWQSRNSLSWHQHGAAMRIASYAFSITIATIWVVYGATEGSWSVVISSAEAAMGSSICATIILTYSFLNDRPALPSATPMQP